MSFVVAETELLQAAASDLAGIRTALADAASVIAGPTTGVLPAAADEVSGALAALFGNFGQQFQVLNAQAQAFHTQFVAMMNSGASEYLSTELANAEQAIASAVTSPVQSLLGGGLSGLSGGGSSVSAANGGGLFGGVTALLGGGGVTSGGAPSVGGTLGGVLGTTVPNLGTTIGSVLGVTGTTGGSLGGVVGGLNGVATGLGSVGTTVGNLLGGASVSTAGLDLTGLIGGITSGTTGVGGLLGGATGLSGLLGGLTGGTTDLGGLLGGLGNLGGLVNLGGLGNLGGALGGLTGGLNGVVNSLGGVLGSLGNVGSVTGFLNTLPGLLSVDGLNSLIPNLTNALGTLIPGFPAALQGLDNSLTGLVNSLLPGLLNVNIGDMSPVYTGLFGPYEELFANTLANLQSLGSTWLADPFPFLHQVLINEAGYGQTILTALQTGNFAPVSAIPGEIGAHVGNVVNTLTDFSITPTFSVGLGTPPALANININTAVGLPILAGAALIGPPLAAFQAGQTSASALISALGAGNAGGAFAALFDAPAVIANGFLNGHVVFPYGLNVASLLGPLHNIPALVGANVTATANLPLDGLLVQSAYAPISLDVTVLGVNVPIDVGVGGTPFTGLLPLALNYAPQLLANAIGAAGPAVPPPLVSLSL